MNFTVCISFVDKAIRPVDKAIRQVNELENNNPLLCASGDKNACKFQYHKKNKKKRELDFILHKTPFRNKECNSLFPCFI